MNKVQLGIRYVKFFIQYIFYNIKIKIHRLYLLTFKRKDMMMQYKNIMEVKKLLEKQESKKHSPH